jgi:ubiquinone/menaquinone biosynthesis C-methylase UbiE
MQRAADVREHGDAPLPSAELGPYLDDLDRLNAWFGGYWLTGRGVRKLASRLAAGTTLVIADVGGARGDQAMRLAGDARRRGRAARILVIDRGEGALAMGRHATASFPEITFVQADATALPFRDGSIDVATMSLTLHHLEPPAAVAALGELRRVARAGVVVNDLLRSLVSWTFVTLATRLFCRHRFSRADGPLSVRRAYAMRELRELAACAGFARLSIEPHPLLLRLLALGS